MIKSTHGCCRSGIAKSSMVSSFLFGLFILLLTNPLALAAPLDKPDTDLIDAQVSKLEGELGKYKDTSPEAGETMVQLADLYHQHGRVFGLVRAAQRFVSSHPTDPRHAAVMLKLLDGLEVLSRQKDFVVIGRQFLTRYPKSPQCGDIEERLGYVLQKTGEIADAAKVFRSRWQRQANPAGRKYGVIACELFGKSGNANIQQGAQLAQDMFERLPKDEFALNIGLRSFAEWNRASQWTRANVIGGKLIKSKLLTDAEQRRGVLKQIATNYRQLRQYSNAAEYLKQVRKIRDDQVALSEHIQNVYDAAAPSTQLEPLVKQYFSKYKNREDRYERIALLALARQRDGNKPQARKLFAGLLGVIPHTHNVARNYITLGGTEPDKLAETEKALREAIAICDKQRPDQSWILRYHLGFSVYRDRIKDVGKAKQVLREFIEMSPVNNSYSDNVFAWLLSTDEDETEFRADVARFLKARQQHPNFSYLQAYPAQWLKTAKRKKELRDRASYFADALAKADQDPILQIVKQMKPGRNDQRAAVTRTQLLRPETFKQLPRDFQTKLLWDQAYFYQHYAPRDQRARAVKLWRQLSKLDSTKKTEALQRMLQVATDYAPAEVAKEAALAVLEQEPTSNYPDTWRRIAMAAEKNDDQKLAKAAVDFAKRCNALPDVIPNRQYYSYLGDVLLKLKLEDEAVALWKSVATVDATDYESRESADRLLKRMEDPAERIQFSSERFKQPSDYQGRYALWLASAQLEKGDLPGFEKTLRATLAQHRERPFRNRDVDVWALHGLLHDYRNSSEKYRAKADEENSAEDILRVARVIADFELDWPSAQANLMLLDAEESAGKTRSPIERQLAYQRVSRQVAPDSHRFDQLMPFAQAAVTRKDYSVAATLLTGMLNNITNIDDRRKQAARAMIGQCYARLGTVGLTIDETSPVAPLLQAALYLRLGDEQLALDTYLANAGLFDRFRDQVPVDLLVFVCENLIAAGGEKNRTKVEDVLRNWMIKNSELATVETNSKARIQFLLAKNFFGAKRYDVARSEFTTVINRYAGTTYATEAEFGIAESFMAQKVYDQAEAVLEKLTNSRNAEIIVRAEFLRGVLAHRRGDNDEARGIFRQVLERVPSVDLANQALFNLSEVYGAEERYMDQLQLLMTVGRLGQVSKRYHSPGSSLSIVVQDGDLGISRGHSRIPVIVRTQPGGDEELIYLTSGGAGKGLFRADVDTQLGPVSKKDNVLQITGNDTIHCDYPDEFKADFKSVPLSDVEIRIASDADFKIASSRIIDEQEESFSDRLEREARERAAVVGLQSNRRPENQIKPGNPIYLRVKDGDRDLGDETDTIVAKLASDSGDQVQVELTETEPHSGIFEGIARTGELPAGALASDTAIDHSPLMAIDRDPETFWLSEPDGATPKTLTVDMKDLQTIRRAKFFVPKQDGDEQDGNFPVRGELHASYDGEFWYRVAAYPPVPQVESVTDQFEQMQYRAYEVNARKINTWQDVVNLVRNSQPDEQGQITDGQLNWTRPESAQKKQNHVIVWFGQFVQPRPGAVRFSVDGSRPAISVNGRMELPFDSKSRTADVWLETGVHELTIVTSCLSNMKGVQSTRVRSNLNTQRISLSPFLTTDFDTKIAEKLKPAATQPVADAIVLKPQAAKLNKKTEQFGIDESQKVKGIGNWRDMEDVLSWTVDAPQGVYDVWVNMAHGAGGGSRFRIDFDDQRFDATSTATRSWQTPTMQRVGTVSVDKDGQSQISITPVEIKGGGLMDLYGVELRPATGARVILSDGCWDFRFDPIDVRYSRFVINEYLGEAVAVNHVEISGNDPDTKFIPTESDVLSLSQNSTLEIAGGDVVTATYTDDVTQASAGGSRLLNGKLQATYFNGVVTPVIYDFSRRRDGEVDTLRQTLKRIEPGERLIVEIVDYDRDQSAALDQVSFEVLVNDSEPVKLTATETEEHSGTFTKEVDTVGDGAASTADKLVVKRGDRVYIRYIDEQNTFPGHSVPRESVVYVNEPTVAQIRILETRLTPAKAGSNRPPAVSYHEPDADAELSNVAFEAPLTVEVIDPDAARNSGSEVIVELATTDGAIAKVRCVISGRMTKVPSQNASEYALERGRFLGQIILQLGSKTSPQIVPITSEMPRGLTGGGVLSDEEEGEGSGIEESLVTRVLNLTGRDRIEAVYKDEAHPAGKPIDVNARGRLISNGVLVCTDRDYSNEVSQLHVGEKLFLMVSDADQDTTDDRDATTVNITTEFGDKEQVQLIETLAHSGVFTGSLTLRSSEKPTPGNLVTDDPVVECYFGDTVRVQYLDSAASTQSGTLESNHEIPVVVGTDGLIAAFSKTFNDETLAVETRFHIAESYFELFKSHRELGRNDEEVADLAAGRRVLREVMEDYPDPKYVPRIAYLMGQFAQELGQWDEAIASYEQIVQQFPDHSLASDAQYKLAQSHEEAGDFDEALEAYVTLAATYPRSPLIANVMIRISDHFYKLEDYEIAAQVGEKFLERFDGHQFAPRIAFRVGQCFYKNEKYKTAGEKYDRFAKRFPDDELSPDALFWAGESYRMSRNNREAFRRYNRCRWDFPESESARYARGRLALPEMLQQFEAEARSVEDQ